MKRIAYIAFLTLFMSTIALATNGLKLGQNYPNPAKGITNIEVEFDAPSASLKLYNVLGKLIIQESLNHSGTYSLDVTNLPEGVYFYTLEAGGEKLTKRLTVKK